MSFKKSAPPLHINLVPSKQLLALLLVIHIGSLVLTGILDSAVIFKITVMVLLLVSMMVSLHKTGWAYFRSKGQRMRLNWQYIPAMMWGADNAWQISTRDGRCVKAHLLASSTCHAAFTALNFRTEERYWWDRYVSVVIFPDAIDKEIFRQLRARLRTRFVRDLDN
jgi:hypothetical protein